jgi:hypothetical protein
MGEFLMNRPVFTGGSWKVREKFVRRDPEPLFRCRLSACGLQTQNLARKQRIAGKLFAQ